MRITAGAYPIASPAEIASLLPVTDHSGDWLLAMDWAGVHELKRLRPNVFCVGRRYLPEPQVDFGQPPEVEADRWFNLIAASKMNPALNGWVGPNEYFGTGNLDHRVWSGLLRGQWVVRFESRLGYRVYYELNKLYWWGSIPVGNLEPSQYALYFRDTLNLEATPWLQGPAYHAYCPPRSAVPESPGDPDYPHYAYRPLRWWNEAGARWNMCLISEAGTYYSWKSNPRQTPTQYAETLVSLSQVLQQMRTSGIPVTPPAVFGYGVEGDFGTEWNVDGTTFTGMIARHNATQPIFPVVVPAGPPDLVPTSLVAPPNGTPGQLIAVSWTVENRGSASVRPPWYDMLYLSARAVVDPDSVPLGAVIRSTPLPVGSSYTIQVLVPLPKGVKGSYLSLRVNDANQVAEPNVVNNTRATPCAVG
ncbi:MAG: hypothetical protein EPO21_21330 [Chloroflexota bacterium]|nr:MAG: hypothetical protein EPO21_21330 [Chloroflexota bacterium]